jgi:integrase
VSVKQTRYGTWQTRWRDIDGKQRAKAFRTRALAEKHERRVRTDTDRGLPTAPGRRLSTQAWATLWLDGAHTRNTKRIYHEALGHLLPELGRIPLHRLSAMHIDRALAGYIATGAAASSVDRAYRTLRTMLNVAVERDLIVKSPMRTVKRPKVPRKEMRFLSADELERLAAAIDPRYRSLILVAGWGGLRWGELAGLRLGDVDHDARRVNVTGQLSTDGRTWKPETKTSGRRTVDLPASVMAELPGHMGVICQHREEPLLGGPAGSRDQHSDEERLTGPRTGGGFVWTLPRGGGLEHSKFRQRFWLPAVAAAGLAPLRVHDLRHTAVALAVAAGAHPAEIQAQLGHTSIKTTLDEYGHIFEPAARQVAVRLEEVRSTARRLRVV